MDSVCYAKKKNGELCNTSLTGKNRHEIKIENGIYFVCGRHKKINNIEDIDISKYEVTDKVDKKDDKDDIINEFNEKLNISNDKKHKEDDNKKSKAALPFFASNDAEKIKSKTDSGEIIADGNAMSEIAAKEAWERRSLSEYFVYFAIYCICNNY